MSLTAEAWDFVPDLAIQVISPNDLAEGLVGKIHEYFHAGVRLVWIVFPAFRTAYISDSSNRVRVIKETDILDGGPGLPGFQLPLGRLFDRVAPAEAGA